MSLPQFPTEQARYPESSQATTALVLGILGIFMTVFAPFAWWMAQRELDAIGAGRRTPENQSTAKVAKVLGIIGTVFFVVAILLVLAFFIFVLPAFR